MSAEGKAAVRHNALRHGLTSQKVVLSGEDPAAFAAMREGLLNDHAPANTQEAALVDQIAANYWRLLRAQRVEIELFESAIHPKAPRRTTRETMEIHEPFAQAFCNHTQHFETLRRYTASIERAYYRSLETLRKLQKDRESNSFGIDSQPPLAALAAAPAALSSACPAPRVLPSEPPRASETMNFGTVSRDSIDTSPAAA